MVWGVGGGVGGAKRTNFTRMFQRRSETWTGEGGEVYGKVQGSLKYGVESAF